MLEWIRFAVVALLMLGGLFSLLVSVIGAYRFHYVLNRIHVAAKCDTMGVLLILLALTIMSGFNMTSLKLLLLIVFVWLASPVASHLIAHLEVATNDDIDKECEVKLNNDMD